MDERTQAAGIADRLLDEPLVDPDCDACVLARQFNRSQEEIESLRWLIKYGERHFGSLWREATPRDIMTAKSAHSAGGNDGQPG